MRWRFGISTVMLPILVLQVLFCVMFYLKLTSYPATLDSVSRKELYGGIRQKLRSLDSEGKVKENRSHVVVENVLKEQNPALERHAQASSKESINEVKAHMKIPVNLPRMSNSSVNLTNQKDLHNFQEFVNGAEEDRVRAFDMLKKRRNEEREHAVKEKRSRIGMGDVMKNMENERYRQKILKSVPQVEYDRVKRLHYLLDYQKELLSVKGGYRGESIEPSLKDDPFRINSSDYFKKVCDSTVEPLVECSNSIKHGSRQTDELQPIGTDIMFAVNTSAKYQSTRLPVLLETWLSDVEPDSVYIMSDIEDEDLAWTVRTLSKWYYPLMFSYSCMLKVRVLVCVG